MPKIPSPPFLPRSLDGLELKLKLHAIAVSGTRSHVTHGIYDVRTGAFSVPVRSRHGVWHGTTVKVSEWAKRQTGNRIARRFHSSKIIQKCADGLKKNIVFFLKMGYSNWNGTEHNFPHQIPIYKLTLLISDTLKPDYYIGLRYDCIPIMGLYIPHFYWLDQKHIYSTILLKTVIYTSIYPFLHLHHGCCYTPRVDEIMNISNEAKVPLVAGRKRSIHCIWLPN